MVVIAEYCESFVSISRVVVSDNVVCDFFVDTDESWLGRVATAGAGCLYEVEMGRMAIAAS